MSIQSFKIIDKSPARNHLGVSVSWIDANNELFKMAGKNAKQNEFQFHCWSLMISAGDDSKVVIDIPLVYFNYKQEVTSASISFDLKDVEEMSEQTKELAQIKLEELLRNEKFTQEISDLFDNKPWTASLVPMNSVHRHPGDNMNSFSATDLSQSPAEPGVVFPIKKTEKGTFNFASIIALQSTLDNNVQTIHTEMRQIVSCTDKQIQYQRNMAIGICFGTNRNDTFAKKFIDVDDRVPTRINYNNIPNFSNDSVENITFALNRALAGYQPEVIGSPDNVTERSVRYNYGGSLFGGTYRASATSRNHPSQLYKKRRSVSEIRKEYIEEAMKGEEYHFSFFFESDEEFEYISKQVWSQNTAKDKKRMKNEVIGHIKLHGWDKEIVDDVKKMNDKDFIEWMIEQEVYNPLTNAIEF